MHCSCQLEYSWIKLEEWQLAVKHTAVKNRIALLCFVSFLQKKKRNVEVLWLPWLPYTCLRPFLVACFWNVFYFFLTPNFCILTLNFPFWPQICYFCKQGVPDLHLEKPRKSLVQKVIPVSIDNGLSCSWVRTHAYPHGYCSSNCFPFRLDDQVTCHKPSQS